MIGQIEQVMKENGALNALMSGSGPTVFGIYKERSKAKEAARKLRKLGIRKTGLCDECTWSEEIIVWNQ